jgi:hypothetical protein
MVKSNRLKQTKHRRRTKHRRQTKHGRHRQYGGTLLHITYYDYRKYPIDSEKPKPFDHKKLFTEDQLSTNAAAIPGYEEIVDMIYEYSNWYEILKKLMDGIERKGIIIYEKCKSPQSHESSTQETFIILLKQKFNFFFRKKISIQCEDTIYYELASHNFRIFIAEILNWNPFLNLPEAPKKHEELEFHQIYGSAHEYKSNTQFKDSNWWESQEWWMVYRESLPATISFSRSVESLPTSSRQAPSLPLQQQETIESLKAEVDRLKGQLEDYDRMSSDNNKLGRIIDIYRAVLVQNRIPLPDVPI